MEAPSVLGFGGGLAIGLDVKFVCQPVSNLTYRSHSLQ